MEKRTVLIVRIDNDSGSDWFINCGPELDSEEFAHNPDHFTDSLYCVVNAQTGEILDNGYFSFADAKKAWPEAVNKEPI